MIVKKKKTYKKQKGGLVSQRLRTYKKFLIFGLVSQRLREKIYPYFDFVKYLINRIIYFLEEQKRNISINKFISDMNLFIRESNNNILIQKLYQKIMYILQNNLNRINRLHFLQKISECVLSDIFCSVPSNVSKLKFPDILKKIFINILFLDYLKVDDITRQNKNELNELFEQKIMALLNKIFHITILDDEEYLLNLLRKLFLEEYIRIYDIPVFYGNTLDSYNNNNRLLGYNQFICEKVGISSKEKRNYIINPVGALAWMYIDKNNYLNTPLYNLLRKILRFDYVQGNKKRDSFTQLPKLEHLRKTTTKFCIAIDKFNNEEVYQEPTDDVSMCSKLYGCSLKMTAEIRKENIASDEHILELLSILLEEELNKPIVKLNINQIQKAQTQSNNRARFFVNTSNNLSIPQQFINERTKAIESNQVNTKNFKTKIKNEIKMMENKISRRNVNYTNKQIQRIEEKILNMKTYLTELSNSNLRPALQRPASKLKRANIQTPNIDAFTNRFFA